MDRSAPQEVLAKSGLVYTERSSADGILCKPRLMPIKSVTLEKLEEMATEARKKELEQQEESHEDVGPSSSSSGEAEIATF